jgi:sugar lactone lactonase YvrE
MIGVLAASPASAWNRGNVQVLAVLPDLIGQPGVKSNVEGLTVGPDGNIYVPSFGFNTIQPGNKGAPTGPANLFVISPNGKIVDQFIITGSSGHMLGLRFNPVTGVLWVLDFGAGNVLGIDVARHTTSILATIGPPPGNGLNALTFDAAGNGYVSDSFAGVIWQIPSGGGSASPWKTDPLLGPGTGLTPPFGANGVEFSPPGCARAGSVTPCTALFVANTAYHQIIQIAVNNGSAGKASPFITGINAPDGIALDSNGNMWICANQEDEIVVIDASPTTETPGKVIAKLGDFDGIDPKGIVSGLLFPASLAFSPDGQWLYVTNLTLFLPYADAMLAIDSAWTLQVNGYTVSRLRAKIPPISGN